MEFFRSEEKLSNDEIREKVESISRSLSDDEIHKEKLARIFLSEKQLIELGLFLIEAVKPAVDLTKKPPSLYPESNHVKSILLLVQNFVEIRDDKDISSLITLIDKAIKELPDAWDVPDAAKPNKSFHTILRSLKLMLLGGNYVEPQQSTCPQM